MPLVFGESTAPVDSPLMSLELTLMPDAAGCAVKLADQETLVIAYETPGVGLAALAEQVRRIVPSAEGRQTPILLRCDDAVSWELVTKVYDVLYGLGARDITFVVKE